MIDKTNVIIQLYPMRTGAPGRAVSDNDMVLVIGKKNFVMSRGDLSRLGIQLQQGACDRNMTGYSLPVELADLPELPFPTYLWDKIAAFRDGHKYFEDKLTGRVSIADQSGSTPEDTDDGVLWLDLEKGIVAPSDECKFWQISLKHVNGKSASTVVSVNEALWLAARYGVAVMVSSGECYRCMEQ
jgi:hypothetical protein